MRKILGKALKRLGEFLHKEDPKQEVFPPPKQSTVTPKQSRGPANPLPEKTKVPAKRPSKNPSFSLIPQNNIPCRDLMDVMEMPFLALSKRRKRPIVYKSSDGSKKVHVSGHRGHFLASIYDWDIVIFVASKMQEMLNKGIDIPPRRMVFPLNDIFQAIHRQRGKHTDRDLEKSLKRLQLTGIQTNIRNEHDEYKASFGFLDGWKYVKRKNDREVRTIEIILSDWLYDGICEDKSLLKVNPAYFDLTSALKRFLYRAARKHAGNRADGWEFSIETLYDKSGSEDEFRKFKSRLKKAVLANDLPEYKMEWTEKQNGTFVIFKNTPTQELDRIAKMLDEHEKEFLH